MGRAGLSAAEKRVLLAELLRKKAAENTAKFPLSYGQKALLYLTRLDPDAPTYNAMFVIRVQAELNIDSLRAALQEMIDRHAAHSSSERADLGSLLSFEGVTAPVHRRGAAG